MSAKSEAAASRRQARFRSEPPFMSSEKFSRRFTRSLRWTWKPKNKLTFSRFFLGLVKTARDSWKEAQNPTC